MSDFDDFDDDAGRFDLALWRRILAHAKPYRKHLAAMCVAGVGVAITESFLPMLSCWIMDLATSGHDGQKLSQYGLTYFAIVCFVAIMVWVFIRLAGIISSGFAYDLRKAGFEHLQKLSFSFYDERPVGWLMARMTADCSRLSGMLPWFVLDLVWGSMFLLSISILMLWLNARLALWVLTIVPPLAIVSVIFQKRMLGSQRWVRKTNSKITAAFSEGLSGVQTSKTLVRERDNLHEFQVLTHDMERYSVRSAMQAAQFLPIVVSFGSVGVGLALWRGGVALGAGISLGELIAFMQFAAMFSQPIQELAARFTELQGAQASAERLQTLLDTEPRIVDSPAMLARESEERGAGEIGRIEFRGVDFSYTPAEPVLRDFDLMVTAGERIALVGETGSGKTTISSLLCRFYEPTAGEVLIDGVDYRERSLTWLQSKLGIVLQSPHLFSGTVAENIRYGRLDASDAEVIEAARCVNAHAFIEKLPQGYQTEVGEGGGLLSTGQKQFISLARAVLKDPQIMIMDEATSAVDTETEFEIQRGVERVLAGRISFVIAHRLSTIRGADRILVIQKGRIVESGTHATLLSLGGAYYRLYTQQFRREAQAEIANKHDADALGKSA